MRVGLGLGLVLLAACGGEPASRGSGGPPATTTTTTPAAGCPAGQSAREGACVPAGVAPSACGEGFVADDGSCAAVLPVGPCPSGTMAVPGEAECRDVMPCGAAPWGDIPIDADTQFVDGSYVGGDSDGSEARPWTKVQAAVDAAMPGAVVAVAAGSYVEAVQIVDKPVALWGRCPAEVEIVATADAWAAVDVWGAADGAEVHGVALRAPDGDAYGIAVETDEVLLDRLWVHDTASHGIQVERYLRSASATVTGTLVERSSSYGLRVWGTKTTVRETVVRETLAAGADDSGWGIGATVYPVERSLIGVRGHLVLEASVVERNAGMGIMMEGADAVVERSVIRDQEPAASGIDGRGFDVYDSADGQRSTLVLKSSVLEKNRGHELFVLGSDATIEATVFRDTRRYVDGSFGRGLSLQGSGSKQRASVDVVGSTIDANVELAAFVSNADVTFDGVLVRGDQTHSSGSGRGLNAQSDGNGKAVVSVTGSVLEEHQEAAVAVFGSDVSLAGTLVRGTHPLPDGTLGDGLLVLGESLVDVADSHIGTSARAGISNFGARVLLGTSSLECNPVQLDGEPMDGDAAFEDEGGNRCGCDAEEEVCRVLSAELEPASPVASTN